MKRRERCRPHLTRLPWAWAVGIAFLLPSPALLGADPFYANLLAKGSDQYNRRDYAGAARTLRLACFGLLDEPERLADGLVRLGLAQAAAGEREAFVETFRRVLEVEERFSAYSRAAIPEAMRTEFERQARSLVPAATLATVPRFSHLAGGASPITAAPAPPRQEPITRGEGLTSPPLEASQELQQVRALLGEGRVVEAYERAKRLAAGYPAWREAQLAAAEAAYRLARWQEAVGYFEQGGDPGEGQPLLLFYWAVSLYEAGDRARAAEALRRALPRIKHTEYVDTYKAKIFGVP